MVTPLVFGLSLELDTVGDDIEQVKGSPSADEATGELMGVNTLFPSPSEDGKAVGDVVLVQVEQTGVGQAGGDRERKVSWMDATGARGLQPKQRRSRWRANTGATAQCATQWRRPERNVNGF